MDGRALCDWDCVIGQDGEYSWCEGEWESGSGSGMLL